jgi:thiol:disulfide interchange protein DsbD
LLGLNGFRTEAAHTQARLVLGRDVARPGETVVAGVELKMDKGWHTYWTNSGASGLATSVDWELPTGVTAGPIQWPLCKKLAQKLPDADLTTYIYEDDVVLLVPLTLAADLKPGPLKLRAKVAWLECEVQCVRADAEVAGSVEVGAESKPSKEAALLEKWQQRLPKPGAGLGAVAWWEKAATGSERPLLLEWNWAPPPKAVDFFPYASESFEVQGPTGTVAAEKGKPRLRKVVKKLEGDWPTEISGVAVMGDGLERVGYEVAMPVSASAPGLTATGSTANGGAASDVPALPVLPLWQALLYAFLGGLILNLMPCVLPVIALKILGFVKHAKQEPREARKLGLIYASGVLVSFLALALLMIGLQAAGRNAGWGIQFSSPYFLLVMTTLVTLIALNLFGVFEVQLGGRAMDAAADLSSRQGAAGAFFNGLLATVLATSCTAPILAAAVGWALAPGQPAFLTLVAFLILGVGLAFPYVVLTWQPGWLNFLPKPGAWMQRFRVVMGFPMLAAAVWLFSLVSPYYGERSLWLALFLVIVGLSAWIYGEFVQRSRAHPGVTGVVLCVLLVGGCKFLLKDHLFASDQAGIAWQPWSPSAVAQARAEGRPILVDFTAAWCLTCNTIVKPALESANVRREVSQIGALALLADYTKGSSDIGDELKRFGRAGVPLVLVYPKDRTQPPEPLPEVLTSKMVVNALKRAAR